MTREKSDQLIVLGGGRADHTLTPEDNVGASKGKGLA